MKTFTPITVADINRPVLTLMKLYYFFHIVRINLVIDLPSGCINGIPDIVMVLTVAIEHFFKQSVTGTLATDKLGTGYQLLRHYHDDMMHKN